MSQLYIIATPIGNRLDITLRALQTLFSVDVLLCEDTRQTKRLLDFYKISFRDFFPEQDFSIYPQLVSFFEHNEENKNLEILNELKNGKNVGLVSNAGTPLISDPGFKLVQTCRQNDIKIITIPGSSALTSALSISGLAPDKVLFLGFLPKKAGKQNKVWRQIEKNQFDQTVVFYESPFRIYKTMKNLLEIFGDIEITIARELTKIHEEVITKTLNQWLKENKKIKGELVLMFRQTHQKS